MPFRSLSAEPEDLQALAIAFDAAWIQINTDARIAVEQRKDARDRLGYILVGLWKFKEADLAGNAVKVFLQGDSVQKPIMMSATAAIASHIQ